MSNPESVIVKPRSARFCLRWLSTFMIFVPTTSFFPSRGVIVMMCAPSFLSCAGLSGWMVKNFSEGFSRNSFALCLRRLNFSKDSAAAAFLSGWTGSTTISGPVVLDLLSVCLGFFTFFERSMISCSSQMATRWMKFMNPSWWMTKRSRTWPDIPLMWLSAP